MSRAVGTPVNQVRHTNVAVVRLKKKGKLFEIACYRNKVLSWRSKVETDLDEVLQIDNIFTNVSKGMLANSKDVLSCFHTDKKELVIKEILEKGELQVTDQERQALQESIFRDTAAIIADKCMNPENNRTYTVSMIQSAMKQIHYGVNLNKSAKSQALDAIKKLKKVMPLARAPMSLRIVHPTSQEQMLRAELNSISGIFASTLHFDNRDTDMSPPPDKSISLKEAGASAHTTTPPQPPTLAKTGSKPEVMQSCRFHADPDCFRRIQDVIKALEDHRIYVEVIALNALAATTPSVADGSIEVSKSNAGASVPTAVELDVTAGEAMHESQFPEKAKEGLVKEEEKEEKEIVAEGMVRSGMKGKGKKKEKRKARRAAALEDVPSEDEEENADAKERVSEEGKTDNPRDIEESSLTPTTLDHSKSFEGGISSSSESKGGKRSKKANRMSRSKVSEDQLERVKLLTRLEEEKKRILEKKSEYEVRRDSGETGMKNPDMSMNMNTFNSTDRTGTESSVSREINNQADSLKSCTTCGGAFDNIAFREHFRTEWHRFNLRRKMDGDTTLTEADFLALSLS